LFRYIDGQNEARDTIAMTAPVSQKQGAQKIAMTAPVSQEAGADGWLVSFMMPSSFTMDTIPVPLDDAVNIRQLPAYRAAAIRYSGFWSEKNYQRHLAELMEWIEAQNLRVTGSPVWARYNAPFTPWFMRRNEILVPVDTASP
ncbi:MAG: heme-binding protein, partial [Lysobacterales bacterium]